MKAIAIGAGVAGLCCAVWLAFSGGTTPGAATGPGDFDYEAATLVERQMWLTEQAGPTAKLFDRSLPRGGDAQPEMRVRGFSVDARSRAITVHVGVEGRYGIDKQAVPAAKKAMAAKACPGYVTSALGQNRVTLNHRFVSERGREELSFVLSPIACRAFL